MEWLTEHLGTGTLATVLSFLVSTVVIITTIKGDVKHLGLKLKELESETNDLKEVVIELAKQEGRVHALEQVVIMQGNRLDNTSQRIDILYTKDREHNA